MANVIRLKRASGSDPTASDLVSGEPAVRTDTGELFFKKDDGSVAKVSGAGGGPDFKYLALRNAANNGAASFPNADFTLVTSGTTSAITPTAANTLLVSVNGVIQKPNTGTSTPSQGFALSGSTIKFGANISAEPDFILYQESGGIGEPSDDTVSEVKLKVSNSPVNGYFLSAQSGNTGGLTWAAPVATSCTGNSATATALATARTINGTSFDGTANITVTAAAGTLTGTTLNSSVTASSLTSLGDLAGLTVVGNVVLDNATNAGRDVQWQHANDRLAFFDNTKATFGNGADLKIYHNGSHSYLDHNGAGNLYIRTLGTDEDITVQATRDLYLKVASGETAIRANANADVQLYHNNLKKFETYASGIKATGNILTTTGDISCASDSQKITAGASDDLQIYHDGSHSRIRNSTGFLALQSDSFTVNKYDNSEGMIRAFADGASELYYDGNKKFETTSNGVQVTDNLNMSGGHIFLADNYKLNVGTGDDLQISHDGTSSLIKSVAHPIAHYSNTRHHFLNADGSENVAVFVPEGQCELYHDGSKKFETTSSGATVTGSLNLGTELNMTEGVAATRSIDAFVGDAGTFRIRGTNSGDSSGHQVLAEFRRNAGVHLNYSGTTRFETTSVGASIPDSGNQTASSTHTTGALFCNLIRPVTANNNSYTGTYFMNRNAVGAGIKAVGIVETGLRVGDFTSDLSATEKIKLTYDGKILIGTTSVISSENRLSVKNDTASKVSYFHHNHDSQRSCIDCQNGHATGSQSAIMIEFRRADGGSVGGIFASTSAAQYNTASDYRLKENQVAISDGITRLKTLKPYRFNWKKDKDKIVDGFFAHEVSSVVPEAITGTKDEVDENNDPVYQGIDHSKLVPLLVAAVQELTAKVEALEAN